MFKPVPFDPYGHRRSRWRPPSWLVLLLSGIGIGAGGVVLLQERYLPPRLSASESSQLRQSYEQAEAERLRLTGERDELAQRVEALGAERDAGASSLASGRELIDKLRNDLSTAVTALPPDPRGGRIEVRAGQIAARGGRLHYEVVLFTGARGGRPLEAMLQVGVTGDSSRGVETTVTLDPVPVSIVGQEVVRGSLPLPEGFQARQASVRLLDRPQGQALGGRVLLVR